MNLVVISVDNLRHDCLGYQEDKRELETHGVAGLLEVPNLDRLAEHSLCFTNCISTNTYTTASHASMFTGLYPPNHGVRAFYATKLADVSTLAGRLAGQGFRTVLYTDAPELFGPLGLDRGFERVLTRCDDELFTLLKSMEGDKVFLFCHFMDVHEPFMRCEYEYEEGVNRDFCEMVYDLNMKFRPVDAAGKPVDRARVFRFPGEQWRTLIREKLAARPIQDLFPLYVQGITKFDGGRFPYFMGNLEEAGFLDGALIALLSDHGEGRCIHDRKAFFCHAGMLYDNVLRVPLMIHHPDIKPGVTDRLVSTVDLAPTLLSILGIESPGKMDGVDILSRDREAAYSEHWITSSDDVAYFVKEMKKKMMGEAPDGRDQGAARWPDFRLAQMSMRTATKKYICWNKGRIEDFLAPEVYELQSAEFVKKLYRDVLGRFEDEVGFKRFTELLDQEGISKKGLLAEFLKSKEYTQHEKFLPRHSMHNIPEDPEEDSPVDASSDERAGSYFNAMRELNARPREAERIQESGITPWPGMEERAGEQGAEEHGTEEHGAVQKGQDEAEQEMLISKLKDLGYF